MMMDITRRWEEWDERVTFGGLSFNGIKTIN